MALLSCVMLHHVFHPTSYCNTCGSSRTSLRITLQVMPVSQFPYSAIGLGFGTDYTILSLPTGGMRTLPPW